MDKTVKNAQIALKKVLSLKSGETVLIITNPKKDLLKISKALAEVAGDIGAKPLKLKGIVPKNKTVDDFIIVQPKKTAKEYMEKYVHKALQKKPNICISIPVSKIGKDREGLKKEYRGKKRTYNNIFSYLMFEGRSRGFWTPNINLAMWNRAIDIDYNKLEREITALSKIMNGADKAHITTKRGTDLWIGLEGRKVFADGISDKKHGGGNMPCGEVFVSPAVGTTSGKLIVDGDIPSRTEKIIDCSRNPIPIIFVKGYVESISKNSTGKRLLASINWSEKEAHKTFKNKKKAAEYAKNARHCGEFGIGLNPKAILSGTVLEDEKVRGTCHFAIGANYDEDAKALTHLDGVVLKPTIDIYRGNKKITVMEHGKLKI